MSECSYQHLFEVGLGHVDGSGRDLTGQVHHDEEQGLQEARSQRSNNVRPSNLISKECKMLNRSSSMQVLGNMGRAIIKKTALLKCLGEQ